MKFYLFILLPLFSLVSKPKVYDCFLFFNELETLDIRLNEMYEYVDHFVLVECVQTFMGASKLLYYARNKDRYHKFNDKIIHVIVTDRFRGGAWDREAFQRNQIMQGLEGCSKEDLIIISDVDEIIRGIDIKKLVQLVRSQKQNAVCGTLKGYGFYLNRLYKKNPNWSGPVATTYGYLAKKSPQKLRDMRNKIFQLNDIGWHFSSLGGFERYITKIENFSHAQEYDSKDKDPKNILAYFQKEYDLVSIDESYPQYVQNHQREFLEMGFIDYEGNSIYR